MHSKFHTWAGSNNVNKCAVNTFMKTWNSKGKIMRLKEQSSNNVHNRYTCGHTNISGIIIALTYKNTKI